MRTTLLSASMVCAAASLVSAHGVQTQITYDAVNNRIDTRSIIYTSANPIGQPNPITSVTAQRRAYIEPLHYSPIGAGAGWYARPVPFLNALGQPVFPTGPGPAWQYDDVVAGTGWSYNGSSTLPNLQGTTFSYKLLDGLKRWDTTSGTFVDPGDEQVQILSGDATTSFTPTATNHLITGDVAPTGALNLGPIASKSGNPHYSISLRLLGDGTTLADGDDGIYLVRLALSTTATVGNTGTPVGDSEPFYFVLTKNASYADAFAALSSLDVAPALIQGQVPEPATLTALAAIGAMGLRRRRLG